MGGGQDARSNPLGRAILAHPFNNLRDIAELLN